MASKKLQHVFRHPQYPLLCSVPGDLISAWSLEQLERRLSQFDLPTDAVLNIIDATGEGWALHNRHRAVSPLTLKKSWKKAELLSLYRESATGRRAGVLLNEKALLRKTLNVLIRLIVELLREGPPNKVAVAGDCRTGKPDFGSRGTTLPNMRMNRSR